MKVILALLAVVATASAGGLTGSYQAQSVVHSHGVVAHAVAPAVYHQPIVHHAPAVYHAAPVAVHHAQVYHAPTIVHTPVVRAVVAQPIIRTVAVAPVVKTIVPTAYASSYSYRAPAAKVLVAKVAQPIVYAAPHPIIRTVAVAPYATAYKTYAHAPIVHHAPIHHGGVFLH